MPSTFPLPRIFNAANYFIDRNLREGRGSSVAIECGEQHVTYAQLFDGVNRTGTALRELGVQAGDRVLLVLLDTPEFAYSFFGAIKIGAVPVPVNTLLRPADYSYLLNDSAARVVIVSEALLPQVQRIAHDELRSLRDIVVVGEAPSGTHAFDDLIAHASNELAPHPTAPDDVAFWLYSSGSTGPPKGCVHRQRDMVVCAEHYARGVLSIHAGDRCFSVAKLFFAYGLGNGLYFPFAVGATTILSPAPPTPAHVYDIIQRSRPTLFFSVPTAFSQMLNHERAATADLTSVRLAVSAGEALPAAIYNRFKQRFGVDILDGIGSTEILHIFISNRPHDIRPGSSGRIVPGYEARLVNESGADVAPGEIGNLIVRGDSICSCYWQQPEKTSDTIQDNWIRTGDKYTRDRDGYFWYAGRADDMLKVNGIWVSPVQIESALVAHEAVSECAVIGRNDENGLEKPMAFIVLRPNVNASPHLATALCDHVKRTLPSFKVPRWIEFVGELPKTATGKMQRYKLRERRAERAA
jgi:benzoate-CoA ligase